MALSQKRIIAIFTGNRAEYGLQYPIIKAVAAHSDLSYRLLVGGAHLQENFGYTKAEIAKDGFEVYAEIHIDMSEDTLYGTAHAIGTGILSVSQTLARLKPDALIVYADRYEGFAAIIAGTQMNIPTAHVEGGDLTEGGALDDSVRHAMTKLAHLHFATNEQAAERIRRLGEEPWRVHNVGYPAIDLIMAGEMATSEELARQYDIDPAKPIIVFTQHSVTTEFDQAVEQLRPSLEALQIMAKKGCQVIITYPNNDAGGQRIINEIDNFYQGANLPIQVHPSLGRYNYHGLLAICGRQGPGVCAGNSSSGIKETAVVGCPAVNIGSRQDRRLRGDNVLDVGYNTDQIVAALEKSLFDESFRRHCRDGNNPYGAGNAGKQIADILATVDLDMKLLQKKMTF